MEKYRRLHSNNRRPSILPPHVDGYIDREEMHQYRSLDGRKAKVLMNGCYLKMTEHWPPSDDILPLFISTHFFPDKVDEILMNTDYLKRYSPIGCRDLGTLNFLQKRGIEAYFSACLTLTLGNRFHFQGKRKGIYFVDPTFHIPSINDLGFKQSVWFFIQSFIHLNKITYLAKKDFFKLYGLYNGHDFSRNGMKSLRRRLYKASLFYLTYRTQFSDEILLSAEYVMHELPVDRKNLPTDDAWCNIAEDYLKKYMSAQLVITSRIHAALPCLGMETPVIFMLSEIIKSKKMLFNSPGRLDGIVDFFRTMNVYLFDIDTDDNILKNIGGIGINTTFSNKTRWRTYAKELYTKCTNFMNTNQ